MRSVVGSIALVIALASCSSVSSSSTLEAEARREADKVWTDLISKCGVSYYATQANDMFEMKGVKFRVSVRIASEVEKMNGQDAFARASIKCNVSRRYNGYIKRWGQWEDGTGFVGGWFDLIKRDGRWRALKPNQKSSVDCSKIPPVGD